MHQGAKAQRKGLMDVSYYITKNVHMFSVLGFSGVTLPLCLASTGFTVVDGIAVLAAVVWG